MSSLMPSHTITSHCPPCPAPGATALDLACGGGRHSFWLADHGWKVTAIDRDLSKTDRARNPAINWVEDDLECGVWPFKDKAFDLIVVVNYLHRPLFDDLRQAVKPGGTILYETFMTGNEKFGRPRSPDFLLQADELARVFSDWDINTFQQGEVSNGKIPVAVKQFISARKPKIST
ncbi:class I SAM-dependent methyltransferase [Thalassospira alkalitolerans]|uniref:class I SAM-dependent methyltransferase n=1 Tax=Thalassospira alkalitolerans TaxID=1293890 RepID=UPI0030EF13BC